MKQISLVTSGIAWMVFACCCGYGGKNPDSTSFAFWQQKSKSKGVWKD